MAPIRLLTTVENPKFIYAQRWYLAVNFKRPSGFELQLLELKGE